MFIGLTFSAAGIREYREMFPVNDIMRIFPVRRVVEDGTELKVLPPWSDARLQYCRERNVVPFLSTKVDGNPDGLKLVRQQLIELVPRLADKVIYLTDRHEPEGEKSARAYKKNFKKFLAMVDGLPPAIRSRIRCGPILTSTWTDNPNKGKGDWSLYDPASGGAAGDFFGGDMYVESGSSRAVVTPSTLPSAAKFTASFKAYRHDARDTRPRLFPELGLIGMPDDKDGSARAEWIQSVYDEVRTWQAGRPGWKQPWSFRGFIWWNTTGTPTGEVHRIGQRRDFALDDRTVDKHGSEKLPGSPPLPVAKINELIAREHAHDRRETARPPTGELDAVPAVTDLSKLGERSATPA